MFKLIRNLERIAYFGCRKSTQASHAVTLLAVAAWMGIPAATGAATEETNPSVKGAYATQNQLPDWSGVWNPQRLKGPEEYPPPYNSEWAQRFQKILAAEAAGTPISDPTADCKWAGVPGLLLDDPYPFEILFTPGRVTILHEADSQIRRMYTDGRKHPAELDPTFNGHSIGRWEGDTLVVDTGGLRGDTIIWGLMPHSDAIQVKERWRLTGPNTMGIEVTMIDPKAFTKPYVVMHFAERRRDWNIIEYSCAENSRNPVVNGVTEVLGPNGEILRPK